MKPASFKTTPNQLHPETIAKCDGPEQFETFDRMFLSVISAPKAAAAKLKRNGSGRTVRIGPRSRPESS